MKPSTSAAFALCMGLLGATAQAQAPSADELAAARKPIEAYFRGHATGNPDEMRKAFLPTAHIEGIRDGKFNSWTLEDYAKGFPGHPAADEAQRTRTLDSLEITGTAAMARATLTGPTFAVVDYFVLLKVDGEWKIANKVYSRKPAAPAAAR
jgi:hypothetical protein